ncbi:TPA: cupin domain-containing protein, partial [Clostridioides difficile]|nr:cupin domain-containing protein [Clostridioides difficile]
PQNETFIVSKTDIDVQVSENKDYRLYCYYPNTPTRNFELFQMELEEGHSYTSVGHSEKSQEYIMIIEGQLKLEVNDSIYQLRENDSICFSAESIHTYHNQGEKTLKAVIINYYPV